MATIVPAVIPESESHLVETLSALREVCDEVQIDIVDGIFVPDRSWPYTGGQIGTLRDYATHFTIEADLMIEEPERVLVEYLAAGVGRIVVHLETVRDLPAIIALKKEHVFLLGLCIGNDTPLAVLEDVIGYADYVQLMGISTIGSQGQPFDERVLTRIRDIREAHRALPISIDGSVNAETIPHLVAAGADRLVAGSAILRAADARAAHAQLSQLARG